MLKIFLCASILLATAIEDSAYAYLDPGSGSYIFQLLLAMLLGAIVTVKIYWQKLKYWISSIFLKQKSGKNTKE
jgi:hypothetical protein